MIRFENVTIQFKDTTLLKDLTFTVAQGDKVLLYGRSGIGKTTIFRLLLGFENIRSGKIFFHEQPIDAKTAWGMRKKVAYVSQDPDIGSGRVMTMLERIFSFKINRHITLETSRIHELMNLMRLPTSMLDDDYEKLSGGEKQRISILIALLLERDIFLLDEVTSSLDAELKNMIIGLFTKKKEWSVLAISHDRHWLKSRNMKVIELRH